MCHFLGQFYFTVRFSSVLYLSLSLYKCGPRRLVHIQYTTLNTIMDCEKYVCVFITCNYLHSMVPLIPVLWQSRVTESIMQTSKPLQKFLTICELPLVYMHAPHMHITTCTSQHAHHNMHITCTSHAHHNIQTSRRNGLSLQASSSL